MSLASLDQLLLNNWIWLNWLLWWISLKWNVVRMKKRIEGVARLTVMRGWMTDCWVQWYANGMQMICDMWSWWGGKGSEEGCGEFPGWISLKLNVVRMKKRIEGVARLTVMRGWMTDCWVQWYANDLWHVILMRRERRSCKTDCNERMDGGLLSGLWHVILTRRERFGGGVRGETQPKALRCALWTTFPGP
jgi:hypothetical protein